MVPRQLVEVEILESQKTAYFKRFLFNLRAWKYQKAIQQHTACSTCRHPVATKDHQNVANSFGLQFMQCTQCHHPFCRTSTCPTAVVDCVCCGKASCDTCNFVSHCQMCAKHFCKECRDVANPCTACNKTFCEGCFFSAECEDCKTTICQECAEQDEMITTSVAHCGACIKWYCGRGDCRSVVFCGVCNFHVCYKCNRGGLDTCSGCGVARCSDPSCTRKCECCKRSLCAACVNDLCNECNRELCDDCFGDSCSFCGKCVCHDCDSKGDSGVSIGKCDTCGESFCGECCEVAHCQHCSKNHCSQCLEYCKKASMQRPSKRMKRS